MFTLKIKTSNAAFQDCSGVEIARILRELADTVQEREHIAGNVMDYNGNTVGAYQLN